MNNEYDKYQYDISDLSKITKRIQRDFAVEKISIREDYEDNLLLILNQVQKAARIGYLQYLTYKVTGIKEVRFDAKMINLAKIMETFIREIMVYHGIYNKFPQFFFDAKEFLDWALIYRIIFLDNTRELVINESVVDTLITQINSLLALKDSHEMLKYKISVIGLKAIFEKIDWKEYLLDYDSYNIKINNIITRLNKLIK